MPSVSACLIVRNEASRLPDCLASLDGQVDEIVIVDTGSTDDSVVIAERFGCRVLHRPWIGDFSDARNFGLDHARGDWILYIDADERLACTGATLKEHIADLRAAAFRVRFHARPGHTAYAEYRIFRNDPRIRFVNAMHETTVPAIKRVCAEDGLEVLPLFDVALLHIGFEGDLAAKHARNIPLLEHATRMQPSRVYIRFHLGMTLEAVGRKAEAAEQLTYGIDLAEAPGAIPQARVEGSMCAQVLAGIQVESGDFDAAMATVDRGLALYSGNLALCWTRARCLLALGRAAEAVAALEPLDQDADTFFDQAIALKKSLFGEDRLSLLGSASFKLGDYAKAAQCFEAAAALADNPLEYRAKAALARARASRVVENAGSLF